VTTETWISVDVETSGPTPATGSLIAIGACLVNHPEEAIELLLRPDPALPWSDEAETVHHLGRDFLGRVGLEPAGSRPVFVALNAPFDWMFVADAAWRHLGRNPFGTSALDIKALYMGRHLDEVEHWRHTSRLKMLERYPVDLPHTHDALDDAREQAAICRAILAGARGGEAERD
jgi:DNA polymerase III epsilon subunit-like protein